MSTARVRNVGYKRDLRKGSREKEKLEDDFGKIAFRADYEG